MARRRAKQTRVADQSELDFTSPPTPLRRARATGWRGGFATTQGKVKVDMGDTRKESKWNALDWEGLVDEYEQYWGLPFVAGFAGVALRSDGRLPVRILRLRKRQGQQAVQRVERAVDALNKDRSQAGKARRLDASRHEQPRQGRGQEACSGVGARELQTFWEALILTRAGYRCAYCGRTVSGICGKTSGSEVPCAWSWIMRSLSAKAGKAMPSRTASRPAGAATI